MRAHTTATEYWLARGWFGAQRCEPPYSDRRCGGVRAIAQKKEASCTGGASRAHACAKIPRNADLTNGRPTRAIVARHLFDLP
jgi:hypothetical protein